MPARIVKCPVRTSTFAHEDGTIVTTYRGTDVVTIHPNGGVTLDDGGWATYTTKHRMNQFSPDWLGVFQHKMEWFVTIKGQETLPFYSGATYHPNGKLYVGKK